MTELLLVNYRKTHIDSVFPETFKYKINRISDFDNEELHPEEHAFTRSMSLKRQNEFKAGRIAARKLLKNFGFKNFPLLPGKNREPLWPCGISGSISHCDEYCLAVVSRWRNAPLIGVDIEPLEPLPGNLECKVCTENEKTWVRSMKQNGSLVPWSKLIFSAKESAYKCIYPLVKKFIDFREAEIVFYPSSSSFKIRLLSNCSRLSYFVFSRVEGRFIITDKYILTVSYLSEKLHNNSL